MTVVLTIGHRLNKGLVSTEPVMSRALVYMRCES